VPYDLELIRLGKVYDNGTVAVSDFDLAVERGEFVTFVGPSGCGKSTTLRMIAGFERITSGDILLRGQRINDLPAERRPTSTIFQNFALFPHMTVQANIEYGLAVKRLPGDERRRRAHAIMEKLELLDVAERRPAALSGGQRQRVALARGLVVEPEVLLLDEPLGALDANLRKSIQAELKLLQRNLGITFIFVTHAQSEALVLSDRIVVMNRGSVEQVSTPYELYTRPRTSFVARFVGRNTIIPGVMYGQAGDIAQVETAHGMFRGTVGNAAMQGGEAVDLVIPSEGMDLALADGGQSGRAKADGNALVGRVASSEVVGHSIYFVIELAGGQTITLESHVEKFASGTSGAGRTAFVTWSAAQATVIRHA
jgi:ABC-type Fe3+/spermidine/putrescine transport system ATPase subunit